jgi:hypothetical protein
MAAKGGELNRLKLSGPITIGIMLIPRMDKDELTMWECGKLLTLPG